MTELAQQSDLAGARRRTDSIPGQARGLALVVLALAAAGAAAMRIVFSPIQEMVKGALHLSDLQISLVQGLAMSIPIALLSIPIGRLIDRVHRVRLLGVLAMCCIVGTALTLVAQDFGVLFVARMLVGFGNVCALPVCISIAADLSSPERRGRALLVLSLGVYGGGAFAFAAGGWFAGALESGKWAWLSPELMHPWRAVSLLTGLASVLMLLPLFWLREPARHELGDAANQALMPALRELWGRRGFLVPLFVGQIGVLMADTAANIWASPVLVRDYGLQPADFGGWMAIVVLVPGVVGTVLGGYVADFGQKFRIRGGLVSGAVAAAAISIPAAFFPVMPDVPGFAWALVVLQLSGAVAGLVTATAVAVLLPNELRGTCLSALFVVSALVAFGLAPTLVTVLSDLLGGDAWLARSLAWSGAVISALSLAGFVIAMLKVPHPSQH